MHSQSTPTHSLHRIPASVLHRWMMKAAAFGLFVGIAAGVAALRAG